jgi:hypothetical protein
MGGKAAIVLGIALILIGTAIWIYGDMKAGAL